MAHLQGSVVMLFWILLAGQPRLPSSVPPPVQDSSVRSAPANVKGIKSALDLEEIHYPWKTSLSGRQTAEMARKYFILGELRGREERLAYFHRGRSYADLFVKKRPDRVEGHYWVALNLAGIAEARAGEALSLLPVIVNHLETARSIDQTYEQGGPLRVLGRIYCEAPGWPMSEGDLRKSLHYLRIAVKIAPMNSTNHLYLARTCIQLNRIEEAITELKQTLASSQALLPCRLEEDRSDALKLLRELGSTGQGRQARQPAGGRNGSIVAPH